MTVPLGAGYRSAVTYGMLASPRAPWRPLRSLTSVGVVLTCAGVLLGFGATACSHPARDDQRTIALHQLPSCPLPTPAPLVDLEALGDFPAGPFTGETPRGEGQRLFFPATLRSIAARTQGGTFLGLSEAGLAGDVPVLLWPRGQICDLAGEPEYPASGGGRALAHHSERGIVLLAGGDAGQTSAVVGALTFHTGIGSAILVNAAERHVLLEPRAFSAAAPFGADLIVTGGEDPLVSSDRRLRPVRGTAEVFSIDEGRFLPDLIHLVAARSHHKAVVLPSGEVLLIGGRDEDGVPLRILEVISPRSNLASLGNLTPLKAGRIEPTVVKLTSGEWLVVGGTTEEGQPVPGSEWLSADASEHLGENEEVPGAYHMTATAMAGGGALIVLGCAPSDDDASEAAACIPCPRGCLPAEQALWLGPDGSMTPVELPASAPVPWLVPAADGSPWLLTGNAEAPWLRFNPWAARFEPTLERFSEQPTIRQAPLALDPGAFVWIEEEPVPRLRGVRTDTRHRFSRDVALLTITDVVSPMWPLHLSPSQPGAASYGDLALDLTTAPTWLTDVVFADVDVRATFSGAPPIVLLGSEPWGDMAHPWPTTSGGRVTLERRGTRVTLRGDEGIGVTYDGESAERLAVGFAAREGSSTRLVSLEVARVELRR